MTLPSSPQRPKSMRFFPRGVVVWRNTGTRRCPCLRTLAALRLDTRRCGNRTGRGPVRAWEKRHICAHLRLWTFNSNRDMPASVCLQISLTPGADLINREHGRQRADDFLAAGRQHGAHAPPIALFRRLALRGPRQPIIRGGGRRPVPFCQTPRQSYQMNAISSRSCLLTISSFLDSNRLGFSVSRASFPFRFLWKGRLRIPRGL